MHVTVVNTQTVSSCTALSMRVSRVSALYTLKLYQEHISDLYYQEHISDLYAPGCTYVRG